MPTSFPSSIVGNGGGGGSNSSDLALFFDFLGNLMQTPFRLNIIWKCVIYIYWLGIADFNTTV